MKLTEARKKQLRGRGHALKPVIIIADSGLTDNILQEFETALAHHELIKVSVRVGDRKARDSIIKSLCESSAAQLVQRIGNMALLYRENPEKKARG
ncbi:MAG: ribosome assembly RNA-binding protein YhbY [Gammaproteobacteria bacterium]|nr:ribosome assembly RNA-binding protein YhbY [Gammaproteobacteria bacterium]